MKNKFVYFYFKINEKICLFQNNEKATKIVDEFLKCENNDGFLSKRERAIELHFKLNNLQKIFEKINSSNNFSISEDDD